MEKVTDKIAALPSGANYFSLEFFPPKTAMVRLRCEKLLAGVGRSVDDICRALRTSRTAWSVCPAHCVRSSSR
jgi:hypothetical protein